jgi:hypothetical protein
MKVVAEISILTNVVLAGVVFALLADRRTNIPPTTIPSTSQIAAPAESVASASADVVAPKPDPFRWGQLESTDYPTYVANLRAIGCPEPTIRDIVSADVDEAIYAPKREELKRKEPNQSLEHALLDLKRGEEAFIASLLGARSSPDAAAATDAVAASQRPARALTETPVTVPLVFQNIDPVAVGMDTKTLPVIASIRERFLKEIGSQQDPNDPAYRERWKKAQANADSQLKGMIGMRAYQSYQFRVRTMAASSAMPQQNGIP